MDCLMIRKIGREVTSLRDRQSEHLPNSNLHYDFAAVWLRFLEATRN